VIKIKTVIQALASHKVDFVIVGDAAIYAYSSAYAASVLDFCYLRTSENLKKIISALAPFKPRFRHFPEDLPFVWDERTLQNGTNFTLETSIGDIDLLGEVAGVGSYAEAFENSVLMKLFDYEVHVLSLNDLIEAKKAAGRPKDLFVLPQLETLQEALSKRTDEE